MKFYFVVSCMLLSSFFKAQDFQAILTGNTSSLSGKKLTGVGIYLIQNQLTIGTCTSDEAGEFIISAQVNKKIPLIVQCSKPGYVSRKLYIDLSDLSLSRKTSLNIIRLKEKFDISLMQVNPLVTFSIGEKEYAEKLKWDENLADCVTDEAYKKKYADSLNKRITDEEGRQLISAFKTKSKEFEQVKNYQLSIQYLDSAAKKATSYQLIDTTIDRKKVQLQGLWTAQIKEQKRLIEIDSLFTVGDSLLALLKWKDAEQRYTQVLKLDPNSAKAKSKIASIAVLKQEEADRDKEIKIHAANRKACTQQGVNKKYKEAIASINKSSTLTKIPQVLKDGIKKTVDSLTVFLNEQNLDNEIKKELESIKKMAGKGNAPGMKASIEKAQGLISNLSDAKKKSDAYSRLDQQTNVAIDAEIKTAYLLHSNGKTEYEKAIGEYEKIKLFIGLIHDDVLKTKRLTDVDTRIADAKNKKLSDELKYTTAIRLVKDNLDSVTVNTADIIGAPARLIKIKTALSTEPLKSKSKEAEVSGLSGRYTKVSAYITEAKKEFPKVLGKDSIVALSTANLLLVKAGTNELGNVEINYLKSLVATLNAKVNPVKVQLTSTVRGTVVPAPSGAKQVTDLKDALSDLTFTKATNDQKVLDAWDGLKEGVDRNNQETGRLEELRSQAQQKNFDESRDLRDVLNSQETEANKVRELAQVATSDKVGYDIAAQNLHNLKDGNARADAQAANSDAIDVVNASQSDQNNAARASNANYTDSLNDVRDVIQEKQAEQNLANTDAQRTAVSAYETAKYNQDKEALEQTQSAKLAQEAKADYVDTRTYEPNYLKDEKGNCFTWNKMTELVYTMENEQGFTTSIITRRIVVTAKGYGVMFEKVTNDQGINSFTLNGQAIPETYWLQYSTGESVFSEGGPITPDCK